MSIALIKSFETYVSLLHNGMQVHALCIGEQWWIVWLLCKSLFCS